MNGTTTVRGLVATTPRHVTTREEGLDILSFRLASTFKTTHVDTDTNWFTVVAYGDLARNGVLSLSKGERVVVTGTLRTREWSTDHSSGMFVEIEAETMGHDLAWGTSTFERVSRSEHLQPA